MGNAKIVKRRNEDKKLARPTSTFDYESDYHDIVKTIDYSKIGEMTPQQRWNIIVELLTRAVIRVVRKEEANSEKLMTVNGTCSK